VWAIKYSPQGDKFASGGDMIRVWSKDGELLIEIEEHNGAVTSLCWSKDGKYMEARTTALYLSAFLV
jgi:WD40 repeat protein